MSISRAFLVCIALSAATGCAVDDPSLSSTSAAAIGPATITTDAPSYHYGTKVLVSWAGMPGNANDWIALAPAGSPMTSVTKWAYIGGAASGSRTLEGLVPGGSYVARGFDNDTYTLVGESDPFDVADVSDTMATLVVDQTDYAVSQPITVTWTGLPGDAVDWVAISPEGRPDNIEATWKYTGGAVNGSYTFPLGLAIASTQGFPGGRNYVARLYLNDTYARVAETAPFLIGTPLTTNASTYPANSAITVSWTHLPGNVDDWIGLTPAGSAHDVVTKWVYTGGGVAGNVTFNAGLVTPGMYIARAYAPDTYFIAGETVPFEVTANPTATITTNATTYTVGQSVTVTWNNLPGNAQDWIALAPSGSPDSTTTRWVYTGGAASGSFTFEGPPAVGTYVARAFLNDTYIRLGESATFTVN